MALFKPKGFTTVNGEWERVPSPDITQDPVIAIAKAFAQGVKDTTPDDELEGVDIWYGTEEYDINVDGSVYHEQSPDKLRILIYKIRDYSETLYEEYI